MAAWRDVEHLFRLAGLFVLGLIVFLVARAWLVPADFGLLGHYRASSPDEIRARPVKFAGSGACGDCHGNVEEARLGSRHARIGCESCHGALAAHVADPERVAPVLPDGRALCIGCHARLIGRPTWLPQVDPSEHAGDAACVECHAPHRPEL